MFTPMSPIKAWWELCHSPSSGLSLGSRRRENPAALDESIARNEAQRSRDIPYIRLAAHCGVLQGRACRDVRLGD